MTAIALITGASGGIGRALARQLHARGCRVAVVGRDAGRLADVEAALRIAADTTTPEGAALAIAACQEALGAAPTLQSWASRLDKPGLERPNSQDHAPR